MLVSDPESSDTQVADTLFGMSSRHFITNIFIVAENGSGIATYTPANSDQPGFDASLTVQTTYLIQSDAEGPPPRTTPEPGTLLLVGSGFVASAGAAAWRQRHKK